MRVNLYRSVPVALAIGLIAALLIAGTAFAARLSDSDHGGRPLTATLTGAAEAPGPGDPDGTGMAKVTLNQGLGEVCFELTFENLDTPTGAHIHRGGAGTPGGIVVGFTGFPPAGAPFNPVGCVTGVDQTLIKEIRQNPDGFYVNIHTDLFGAGAIRGQLSK